MQHRRGFHALGSTDVLFRGARRLAIALAFSVTWSAAVPSLAQTQRTVVSIQQDRFLINGTVTHQGTAAEGLLLNSRMVQAIFDDENPSTRSRSAYPDTGVWDPERNVGEFIAALPVYAAKGLRAVTVNLQGGSPGWTYGDNQPGVVSAFNSDGSIKYAWLDRLDRVIRAADQNGIVVIVGMFYFGQDHRLANEAAVIRAVDAVTDWLVAQDFQNVLVEINNEADLHYNHAILQPARVPELISRVRQRSGGRLKTSTSLAGGSLPSSAIISASDYVLLHGNGQSASQVGWLIDQVRSRAAFQAAPKPIVFNEDSTSVSNFETAIARRASWGYYDQGANNYWDGFQSPPVQWSVNTHAKRAFFDYVAAVTGSTAVAPPPSSESLEVASLSLINADTNQAISGFEAMVGAATVSLTELPTRNLNIRANTASPVGSVRFGLNGNSDYVIENVAPYALAGDSNGDYRAWQPGAGTHTVTATAYSGPNATGSPGQAITVQLTIVDGPLESSDPAPTPSLPPPPPPSSSPLYISHATLINADTDGAIAGYDVMVGGTFTVNLAQLPTKRLNLAANTWPTLVGSVKFAVNGAVVIENAAPYALAGDTAGDFAPWKLGIGTHTITMTPFTEPNAAGTAGPATTLTITLVDSTTQTAPAPAPSPTPTAYVSHFTLINADTDQPVVGYETLAGGTITLTLSQLSTQRLNLRANTYPAQVGSVRFGVNSNAAFSTENMAPYALGGDTNGNYNPWTLGTGTYAINATPYTGANGTGTAGAALSITLVIVK